MPSLRPTRITARHLRCYRVHEYISLPADGGGSGLEAAEVAAASLSLTVDARMKRRGGVLMLWLLILSDVDGDVVTGPNVAALSSSNRYSKSLPVFQSVILH